MADGERLRLFVAVRVPGELLDSIDAMVAGARDDLAGARWVPVENQHVTLKFLGPTPSDGLAPVVKAIRAVVGSHRPFETRLEPAGAFPSPRRARVLWIGLDDRAGHLASVAEDLDQALEALGYESEKRAFSPHLTLARFKVPKPVILPDIPVGDLAAFAIQDIGLYRSRLHPKGARYELVETFPLGA